MNKRELYLAAKYEVEHFKGEHGMNLAEMWGMIHGKFAGYERFADWWRETCLEDYREQRI